MELYAIRSKDGKYFRAVGMNGGKNWVDKLEDAKFYTKHKQAVGRITFWFNNYPKFGCPELLVFTLSDSNMQVVDMEQETKKKLVKNERAEFRREKRYLEELMKSRKADHAKLTKKIAELEVKLQALT